MTPKQILSKYNYIQKKMTFWCEEETRLQTECPHYNVFYRYRGSFGNWDNDNEYWLDWNCEDCKKSWMTDQKRDRILKYPNAKESK